MPEMMTSVKKITIAERERRAVQLRLAGADYQTIADTLGISKAGAFKAVKRSIEKTKKVALEDAEQLRSIEQSRLESLILTVMPMAKKGNLQAVDSVRKLSESLRKLLGLDEPEKIESTGETKVIVEYVDFEDSSPT